MAGDESTALMVSLGAQRAHVLGILDGLGGTDLRRPVLPSGWSCLGLVSHLTLDVERFWFRAVFAGEQVEMPSDGEAWRVGPEVASAAVVEAYRREIALTDAIIASEPLDTQARGWPEGMFGGMARMDLRQTVLHVLTEAACHAGHLDAARELIDGRSWLVLTP